MKHVGSGENIFIHTELKSDGENDDHVKEEKETDAKDKENPKDDDHKTDNLDETKADYKKYNEFDGSINKDN